MTSVTESEGLADSGYGSNEPKVVLDVATKDLFRKNAFRITGLSVDATPRDVAKQTEKLKVLAELGQEPHSTAAFLLRPSPTSEEIRDAIQRLKDPEKRLIDEFFWFWPQNFGESRSDAAIEALQTGDLQGAVDIWISKRKDPTEGTVATHNLALVFHIKALDWEIYSLRNKVDTTRQAKIAAYWKAAFYRWNQVLSTDRVWEKVTMRVYQLNEPNLTTDFVRRMRAAVPGALVKVNAELALAFAEAGKAEQARVHAALMDGVNEVSVHVGNIVESALAPARRRLHEHVRNAKQSGDKNPSEAIAAARQLLDHTRSTLSLFDLFVTKNAHLRDDAFDEVAETCNQLQVTYHKATSDNECCLAFLKTVLPFAASQELREQIERNIQVLTENIAAAIRDKKLYGNLKPISSVPSLSTINGIGFTLYGSTDVDNTNGSYITTYYFCFLFIPIFPICRYRVTREGNSYRFLGKAPLRTGDKWHLAIILGTIVLLVISGAISDSSQSQSSSGYTSRSSAGNSLTYLPNSQMRAANDWMAQNLRSDHDLSESSAPSYNSASPSDREAMRSQLRARALADEKAEIDSERASVEALEGQVTNLAVEIKRERPYLDRTSEYDVAAFNAKVDRYTTLLRQARHAAAAFDRKVDDYNAKLPGNSEPPPVQSPSGSASDTGGNGIPDSIGAEQANSNTTVDLASSVDQRPTGVVKISTNDTLNVRADASADSAIVGTLRSGDHVYLEPSRVVNAGKGVPVTWQKITSFSGYGGWVNVDYISAGDYR